MTHNLYLERNKIRSVTTLYNMTHNLNLSYN